jgi:hypothetical protein
MARKVRQIRQKGKHIRIVPVPSTATPDVEARAALIQALIPVALDRVGEELQGRWSAWRGNATSAAPGHRGMCASRALKK